MSAVGGKSRFPRESLARELNLSVRTLHRTFATAGESVAAYVRRRRLERGHVERCQARHAAADLASGQIAHYRWHEVTGDHLGSTAVTLRAFTKFARVALQVVHCAI